MKEKSIVGDLINFRGLVYSPVNEDGVIFLFGKVIEDLNMYIEEIKAGFPDCIGRRFTGRGWEKMGIEFEYRSSHFKDHGHDPHECDMIVCWEHDWLDCPLEVIELRDVIKSLPNKPMQRPEVEESYTLEDLYKRRKVTDDVKKLFEKLDNLVKKIDAEIVPKIAKTAVTYYSPERVFLYTWFRQRALVFDIFTNGEKIEGVKNYDPHVSKGGAKWGWMRLDNEKDLDKVLNAVKKSYQLIKLAVKNKQYTGWYAKAESEQIEALK